MFYANLSFLFLFSLVNPCFAENIAYPFIPNLNTNPACKTIAHKLASVSYAECLSLDLKPSALSEQEFPLLLKEFPPKPNKKPLGRILLIGGIHGDEYSSVSVTFKWLTILQKHHSGLFHWLTSPLVNPDGLLQKKSQRINSRGVDLNRNFPSAEPAITHLEYWEEKTFSALRKYPGLKPLSEKESLWVDNLIKAFKPDVIVSVHAPFGLVDFDGEIKNKSVQPPTHLGPLHLHLLGSYPGSLGRYGSEVLHIPVITVELEYAGIMPSKHDISQIWVDLVLWLKNNIEYKNR